MKKESISAGICHLFILSVLLSSFLSCSKNNINEPDDRSPDNQQAEETLPVVSIQSVTDINEVSLVINANIDGTFDAIEEQGACWSTSPNPTIQTNKINGSSIRKDGSFTIWVTKLSPSTTYYLRVFAKTKKGNVVYSADSVVVTADPVAEKEIYFPYWIWDGGNNEYITQSPEDYDNPASRFSVARMKTTKNFVVFWESGFGSDPGSAQEGYKVNLNEVMDNLESMYNFYRDKLKFVEEGNSLTDKYRMVVYLFYDKDFGTVYGSGADDKVGVMLLYPSRIQYGPYGALAHELGHAFQYMVHADGSYGYNDGGPSWEMTSQYMLWQYYLNWPEFEGYHVDAFLDLTYLSFMHEDNQYHSPFVLEYWADKYGQTFVADMWQASQPGDDFILTYKQMNGLSQTDFNDEMFDAARKFITWDIDRVRNIMAPYSNLHHTLLINNHDGWYRVDPSNAPQNYGYNGIRLNVPAANTEVTVDFEGMTAASGYNIVNADKAGWRYGFVAQQTDGSRTYSDVFSKTDGQAVFEVPASTDYLWLVVMGAPTEHWKHEADYNNNNDEQWPYQIKVTGTTIY